MAKEQRKDGADRRRSRRARHRLKLRFWGDSCEGVGFTHDLSVTGMLIETTSVQQLLAERPAR